MDLIKGKKVLVSGASIAGLATAYWMNSIGYQVTVVEISHEPRIAGAAIDIRGTTVDLARRMDILDQLKAVRLHVDRVEFKNAHDVTEGSIVMNNNIDEEIEQDDIEIERDKFLNILMDKLKNDVEFIFSHKITALDEKREEIEVTFNDGVKRAFDLVLGCDGTRSGVRKIWFGDESEYEHFLEAYFSITIVNKLLIEARTMQMFNVPNKAITLNAYNNKTDIIFSFYSEKEISYNYKDEQQTRDIILNHFIGLGWKTAELLKEVQNVKTFYFDRFCQIKMPSWTKGRVALIGDAGYCASPAAGMGASLAMNGASALADALQKNEGNFELAFQDYNINFRPFVEETQAMAEMNVKENFIPRTEEAIRKRNINGF